MNWKLLSVFAIVSVFTFTACDNDIDLTADWESIPVVYGFINAQDTAHYLRVEKAFLDPSTGAPTLAQIPDSLYYDDIVVQIERTGASVDLFTMDRVDGNLEGYVREDGIFASAPNYLYKLKLSGSDKLQGGDQLKLILKIGENQEVTANTVVTSEYELTGPSPLPGLNPGRQIGFLPGNDASTKWRDDAGTSAIFDVNYYVHYREKLDDNAPFENKMFKWRVVSNFVAQGTASSTIYYLFPSIEFYSIISANIDVNPSATRILDSVDVEILGAGEEFLEYREIGLANTGITSSQVIPTFSNLSEGRGIFTSATSVLETGFKVANRTKDSLAVNSLTRDLNLN